MKTIKFLQDWRYSRKGDVIEEGDGVAELLIARRIAEEVTGEEATDGETTSRNGRTATGGDGTAPRAHDRRLQGPREGQRP